MNYGIPYLYPFPLMNNNENDFDKIINKLERLEKNLRIIDNRLNKLEKDYKINNNIVKDTSNDMYII